MHHDRDLNAAINIKQFALAGAERAKSLWTRSRWGGDEAGSPCASEVVHLRKQRMTGENLNAVRRELANLEEIGLLKSTRRGNALLCRGSGFPHL